MLSQSSVIHKFRYKRQLRHVRQHHTSPTGIVISILIILAVSYYIVTTRQETQKVSIRHHEHSIETRSHKNTYTPDVVTLHDMNIEYYDLKDSTPDPYGWNHEQRVLILVPLRNAADHVHLFISSIKNITYPHHLIDLAFLVSDTKDTTIRDLKIQLRTIQNDEDRYMRFRNINIYEKDFGQVVGQSFSDRHSFQAQGPRRKKMAIARNWLLATAIKPYHSWIYWRDADVETMPATIIEDLIHHNKDVIVPNVWRPLPEWLGNEQPYDLNSWKETEGGLDLANTFDEDSVIVEGYSDYKTHRLHLAYLRDPFGDKEVEMDLDGVGGVALMVKRDVFFSGAIFPAFSYQKHAETEAFGKLSKTMGFQVVGLPNYVIWHIYEPSLQDLKHMEWMDVEKKNRLRNFRMKKIYKVKWKKAFSDVTEEWEQIKYSMFKNSDLHRNIQPEWNDVDQYLRIDDITDTEVYSAKSRVGKRKNVPETFDSFPISDDSNVRFVRFDEEVTSDDNNLENGEDNLVVEDDEPDFQRQDEENAMDHNQKNNAGTNGEVDNESTTVQISQVLNDDRALEQVENEVLILDNKLEYLKVKMRDLEINMKKQEGIHRVELEVIELKELPEDEKSAETLQLETQFADQKREFESQLREKDLVRLNVLADRRKAKKRLQKYRAKLTKENQINEAIRKEIQRKALLADNAFK